MQTSDPGSDLPKETTLGPEPEVDAVPVDRTSAGQAASYPPPPVTPDPVPAPPPQSTPPIRSSGPSVSGGPTPSARPAMSSPNFDTSFLQPLWGPLSFLDPLGRQVVAWIGSALLFIGVFLPAKSVNIIFTTISVSFWDYSHFWGLIVMLCAILSAFLAFVRDYKWLVVTGGIALVGVLIELINDLSYTSWGFILLIPGAVLILAAAAMRPNPNESQGDAFAYVNNMINKS